MNNNETWTDWLIQCDMLQDISGFAALDWMYSSLRELYHGHSSYYNVQSGTGKRTYSGSLYSFTASRKKPSRARSLSSSRTHNIPFSYARKKYRLMKGSSTSSKQPKIMKLIRESNNSR